MTKEKRSENFFASLPLPITLVSPGGEILEANLEFSEFLGFPKKELIGKSIENFFDKEDIKELFRETLEKGFVKGKEINILTKEKKKIPVSVSTAFKKDPKTKIEGFLIGLFDLTDYKKTEAALLNLLEDKEKEKERAKKERRRAMAIVTSFSEGLLLFNNENKLLLINPQAKKMLELEGKEVIGKQISELIQIPIFQFLSRLLEKEIEETFKKEIPLEKNLILKATLTPLRVEEEKRGTLIILRDITREKLIERTKSEFVSLSAHQLRTPLSAIKWSLRMLLDGDVGELRKEQKELLEKTYRSNERMINLINDLLNVSRIEEGRYLYRPLFVDLAEVVESVIHSFKRKIEDKNIKFELKKPEKKLPQIKMDREKMKLAIENLLDNAIRYTSPGGEVTISLTYDKKEIEFKIQDTGTGIPKYQQGRVFTKFFRGVNAIKTETEGSGLGLFITKNIIEAHRGRIWFESEERKGSTFYFTLPVKSSKPR